MFPQERGGNNSFTHEALTLKYKLDNQFELVFVVSRVFKRDSIYTFSIILIIENPN